MAITNTNPWIGLDSYEEGQKLYGRDNEILSLSEWIMSHPQTILCGRSGIGKTSILNAGISPILRDYGYFPVNIRLEHGSTSYINQIKNAVFDGLRQHNIRKGYEQLTDIGECYEMVPAINQKEETMWEFFHRYMYYDLYHNRIIPVIIFDQFEEIFTLGKDVKKINSFFIELANLLNNIMPEYIVTNTNNDLETHPSIIEGYGLINIPDIYSGNVSNYLPSSDFRMIITLREDCLSILEQYIRDIPSLKQSKYFLQPITGEDALSIIMDPRPNLVDKNVALKIISTINKDIPNVRLKDLKDLYVDSAILSLCLSQLYINKSAEDESITLSLVEQFDNRIIDNFYSESIRDIPINIIEFLEDNLVNGECKRECISLYQLHKNAIPDVYIDILTNERKLLRKFVRNQHTMIEFIHDILCPIVDKHKQHRHNLINHHDGDFSISKRIKDLRRVTM